MHLLRNDILIAPSSDGCELTDERTGKTYEFGEVEYYLIEQFRSSYCVDEVAACCNKRFDQKFSATDVDEFLHLLATWGLLGHSSNASLLEPKALSDKGESADAEELGGQPNRWHLFNPQGLFDVLNRGLVPVRKLVWLTPLMFIFGLITMMSNWDAFFADLSDAFFRFGLVGRLLFAAITVNLISQVLRGLVARYFQLRTPSLGVILFLGLIPRFNVQVKAEGEPSRNARLWLTSISITTRLLLFGFAALLWGTMRSSGSSLAFVGVELALLSVVGLILVANPLWRGDGVNFLSAWLDVPHLQKRSKRAMLSFFIRQPEVLTRHTKHRIALGLFGLAAATFFLVIVVFLAYTIFRILEAQFQGAGVALFLLLVAYVSLTVKRQGEGGKVGKTAQTLTGKINHYLQRYGVARNKRLKKGAFLIVLMIIMVLPYRYETGGVAEVFPIAKASVSSETTGIIDQVFVNGGEWVDIGAKLARMSHYRQLKDVATTEAAIRSQKFKLQQYLTTPSLEQRKLSEAELQGAKLQFKYSGKELKRLTPLYKKGIITLDDYEKTKRDYDLRHQDVRESKLNLEVLLSQVNPNEIKSLEADIERLEYEVKFFNEELDNTYLISPIQGQIIGEDLKFKQYSYIGAGEVFAEIENTRSVSVRIEVPEADVGDARLGSVVTIKLWAYPDMVFLGKVDEVEPATATEEAQYGRIIYVTSHLDNPEGLLIRGLTGHAKITGGETIVALAFSRAFMRFLHVEVWSWLP